MTPHILKSLFNFSAILLVLMKKKMVPYCQET
uniref:Uncharacterized protein n=1 Tax=Anguilla anguilla TaxID=7936 RepID=A0A0E9V5R1_ANGAN